MTPLANNDQHRPGGLANNDDEALTPIVHTGDVGVEYAVESASEDKPTPMTQAECHKPALSRLLVPHPLLPVPMAPLINNDQHQPGGLANNDDEALTLIVHTGDVGVEDAVDSASEYKPTPMTQAERHELFLPWLEGLSQPVPVLLE